MSIPLIDNIRKRADEPMSARGLETLACVALAVWVCGQILFGYSTFGDIWRIKQLDIAKFHQAIAAGCLIAAIAAKGFQLRPILAVGLFVGLFATLTIWRRGGDVRPLMVLLFAAAASSCDIARLARFYVLGALFGMAVVLLVGAMGKAVVRYAMVDGMLTSAYGFDRPVTLALLLLGVVCALVIGERDSLPWPVLAGAAMLSAVVSLLVLHAVTVCVMLVLVAVFVVFERLCPQFAHQLVSMRAVRIAVAVAPIVLFFMATDGAKFYNFPMKESGFAKMTGAYGLLVPLCLSLLYLYVVLRADLKERAFLALCLAAIWTLLMIFEVTPVFLEFNCALLFLAEGFGSDGVGEEDGRLAEEAAL